ncbi:fimbrillin family protein [Phocaeicola plebeius]|uniref:fimbrillin family protein n=1 Tax=Phocaeicola plebeius TaxID=310297 RepID=UPI0026ED3A0C|nr:fimbrillin family protein [Phocaeicola plebeius]
MRNIMKSYRIGVCLLLLSVLLPTSCIKDNYPAGEKASVTMTFTTRVQSDAPSVDGSVPLLDNEQMKTLRVIVARKSGEILFNVKYDIDVNETFKKITFSELTTNKNGEKFDFYAIANEEAFLDAGESLEGKEINLTELKARVINKNFNSPALSQLPQAAYQEIEVKPGENNEATMQLLFPVAKINLSFVNTTGSKQHISEVKLQNGTPNGAKLFYDGNMPTSVDKTGMNITFDDFALNAGGENTSCVRYVYPGETDQQYVITAKWNGKEYTLPLAVDLTNLARGSQYNVTITLIGGDLTVSCKVQDWEETSHEVQLSDKGEFEVGVVNAYPFSWDDDKKAIATQYGEGAGAADRYATLTLRMTTPLGVTWQAHLDNPAFEFVGESAGVGVGTDAGKEEGVVTLKIRPVNTYDATQERRTANLYVTLGTKPNEHALFVDHSSWTELCTSDGVNIPIVQVSSTEGDNIWSQTAP